MTNTHKHSRRLTTRREVTRHTKSLFREPTKPRAQHAQTTREDTDQGGRSTARPHTLPTSPLTHTQTTESDLTSPTSAFSGCSSSPAQLKSGPAPAATASETAAGRLGHRTGMPAAPDAAAPASSSSSSPLASALGSTFRPWPPIFWPIAVPMTEESNRLIDSVYVA